MLAACAGWASTDAPWRAVSHARGRHRDLADIAWPSYCSLDHLEAEEGGLVGLESEHDGSVGGEVVGGWEHLAGLGARGGLGAV